MKEKIYGWWKQKPSKFRKPLVFTLGILLLIISPIAGSVPGPGGIALFILSIAILASEFDWAEQIKSFVLKTVPSEVKNRWQPTPRWQIVFDISAVLLLIGALLFAWQGFWLPVISFSATGICIALFNRSRLTRFKKFIKQ